MTARTVPTVSVRHDGDAVCITRGEDVEDQFWLRLRAEWGSRGGQPARQVQVPLEVFLGRLGWLRDACLSYGTGVDFDDLTRALIRARQQEQRELDTALHTPAPASPAEVRQRLEGTRFIRPLMPFQERDLSRLMALPHGANFGVPGSGKTTVTYACYEAERRAGRVERLLVVAPISAFDAWITEAQLCFDEPPTLAVFDGRLRPDAEIVLVNYQRLAAAYDALADWVRAIPTAVVLDEAHRMKRGWAGQWGTACLNLSFLSARRDVLTGTPAPQGPADLAAVLGFVWPNQGARLVPTTASNAVVDTSTVSHSIAPLFTRTTKNELGLRPPRYRVLQVPLDGLHREIYDALLDRYAGVFPVGRQDRVNLAQLGEVVMYLLEAATNPALLPRGSSAGDAIDFQHPPLPVPPGHPLATLLSEYEQYETPAKFVQLARLVSDNAALGRKTLVWSNFVRNLTTLDRMLAALRPAVIHGGVPTRTSAPRAPVSREDEIARFRTDDSCMVLLANPAAMSEGISLHDVCRDAIYLERTFNAGQYLQSVDRIHRLGLPSDAEVRITFLLTSQTIDEVVDQRVRVKAQRLGDMLADPNIAVMALPDDEDYGPALEGAEDLAVLFAHLRGASAGSAA